MRQITKYLSILQGSVMLVMCNKINELTCSVRNITPLLKGRCVKKQPSQDVLHGDAAEEELGLAHLVSSYTLPHQNSQPGGRGWQTACSKVLSRHARDT